MSERDKFIDAIRSVPYSLRLVALVLIFNGMFALIKSATILIGNDVELDWRIVNLIIGYGLLMKQRILSIAACISVTISAILHVKSVSAALSNYQFWGAGGVIYFIVALAVDAGMLSILFRNLGLKNHLIMKGKS